MCKKMYKKIYKKMCEKMYEKKCESKREMVIYRACSPRQNVKDAVKQPKEDAEKLPRIKRETGITI